MMTRGIKKGSKTVRFTNVDTYFNLKPRVTMLPPTYPVNRDRQLKMISDLTLKIDEISNQLYTLELHCKKINALYNKNK